MDVRERERERERRVFDSGIFITQFSNFNVKPITTIPGGNRLHIRIVWLAQGCPVILIEWRSVESLRSIPTLRVGDFGLGSLSWGFFLRFGLIHLNGISVDWMFKAEYEEKRTDNQGVTTTMLSFAATIFLFLHFQKKAWTNTVIYMAAFLPVSMFALMQFPLYAAFSKCLHTLIKKIMKKAIPQKFIPHYLRTKKRKIY